MDSVNYSNLTIVVRNAHGDLVTSAVISEPQTGYHAPAKALRLRVPALNAFGQWLASFGQHRETPQPQPSLM